MKYLRVILFFILFCSVSQAQSLKDEKLKIGLILPLGGEGAAWGDAIKNGAQMAYDNLSTEQQKQIELIFEDDSMTSTRTVSAFNKLVDINNIDVVVNVSSGTANAIAPLAEQKKIPFISISSDKQISDGKKYVVSLWVTPEAEAKMAFDEAINRGYKRIVQLTTFHTGALAVRDAFNALNDKIEVVLSEEYPYDVRDFRTFLTRLKAKKNVDAIMLTLLPGQCGVAAKQIRDMGIGVPIFGYEMFEDGTEVKASNNALVGQWYVNTADASGRFVEEYKKRYPKAQLIAAANGYDAMMLVADAIKRDPTRDGIANYLRTVKDFEGALGNYSATGDNRFSLPASVKLVTEDGFKELHR